MSGLQRCRNGPKAAAVVVVVFEKKLLHCSTIMHNIIFLCVLFTGHGVRIRPESPEGKTVA